MHSVEDAMAGWVEHLGCGGIETMAVTQNVERREYQGCGTMGALTLYALRGSGHTWPGSSFAFPDYLGSTEANIDATVLSLDWFERHRRAGNPGSSSRVAIRALSARIPPILQKWKTSYEEARIPGLRDDRLRARDG